MSVSFDSPYLYEISCQNYLDYFNHVYKREFGNDKTLELVVKSKACNDFIVRCIDNKKITPSSDDFVATVLSSRYFMFSKSEKVCLASIFLLRRLMGKIDNLVYSEYPYNDKYILSMMIIGIIKRCMKMKIHAKNADFYQKVYDFFINQHLRDQAAYYESQREIDDDWH